MKSTVLNAQDYKNIIGLIEGIPKSYTSNIKRGYTVLQRLFESACSVGSIGRGFSSISSRDLQNLVEENSTDINVTWDDPINDYSKLPSIDLDKIKEKIESVTYGVSISFKEINILHHYLLKNNNFNLYEIVQNFYINKMQVSNVQSHILNLFVNALDGGIIKMEEFNKPLWKILIENNVSKGEKYLAKDLLSIFTKILIKNKNKKYIEEDWLLKNINKFFDSQKTINKATTKKLNEFLNNFKEIELTNDMSPYLLKYLNNSNPIKESNVNAYSWEVDLNHLSNTEDISIKILKGNLDSVIKVLSSKGDKIPGIINLHSVRTKDIISIYVIYKDENSITDISSFISFAIDNSRSKSLLDVEGALTLWDRIQLNNTLSKDLLKNPKIKSNVKKI